MRIVTNTLTVMVLLVAVLPGNAAMKMLENA